MTAIETIKQDLLTALLRRRRLDAEIKALDRGIDALVTQLQILETAVRQVDAGKQTPPET